MQNPRTVGDGHSIWQCPDNLRGDNAPGSWGGHCVPIMQYNASASNRKGYEVISWGEVIDMTPLFMTTYGDEAYVVLSQDWIASGKAPNGFNLAQLMADLQSITS